MPLANSYLRAEQVGKPEPRYPLHARVCSECRLVQVDAVTTPDAIFSDYAYFSSTSASWVDHARRFVVAARERFSLGPDSSRWSKSPAMTAICCATSWKLGFRSSAWSLPPMSPKWLGKQAFPPMSPFSACKRPLRLKSEGHAADLVVGNNVFAHVPDINDFVAGLAEIVKPDGVISLEFPHPTAHRGLVQFDTIYHEHYSYLSLLTTERIFAKHGLRVFDVEELPTHGGSLRVSGCRADASHVPTSRLERCASRRGKSGARRGQAYEGFTPKVEAIRTGLLEFLRTEKAAGTHRRWIWRCGEGQHPSELLRHPARSYRLCRGSKSAQARIVSPRQSDPDSVAAPPG